MSEKLNKFRESYFSDEILDIYHLFTKDQLETIKKLGLEIQNKKYSVYDFDVLEMEIIKFYKIQNELKEKNITTDEYMSVVSVFDKISEDECL